MDNSLVQRFQQHRDHVRLVAYRMLGSCADADDAVQEVWLRLASVDAVGIDNLAGWLTTVVSRVSLDMLRARISRREDLVGHNMSAAEESASDGDPEHEAMLVDEVGRAVLVVLDRLSPDERIAFVLHDMFSIRFDEIAPIVERSAATTKKLASRARQKMRGHLAVSTAELVRHRRVVETFLAASRAGDIEGLLAVLAPNVIRRADRHAIAADRASEVQGAQTVANEVAIFGRNAHFAAPLLVNGTVGIAIAPHGRLRLVLTFEFESHKITEYKLVADPTQLEKLKLAVLPTTASAA